MSKGRLKDAAARPQAQQVLAGVLDGILRLVQPVMPFVAEALWQALNEAASERGLPTPVKAEDSVVIAKWPTYPEGLANADIENAIARMQDLVRGVREVRNRYQVDPKTRLDLAVKCSQAVAMDFTQLAAFIGPLAGLSSFEAGPAVAKPKQSGSIVRAEFEAYVPLAGLIDKAAEAKKTEKEIGEKRKQLDGANAKLANANFVAKAPPEQVQEVRDKVAELEGQLKVLEANLKDLLEE
jgi:valyl-tRNA synthetase